MSAACVACNAPISNPDGVPMVACACGVIQYPRQAAEEVVVHVVRTVEVAVVVRVRRLQIDPGRTHEVRELAEYVSSAAPLTDAEKERALALALRRTS